MTEVLLRMLLGVTVGLALVLALRRPARRLFGAGPAFTLWLLPLVLLLAPLLPRQLAPAGATLLPALVVGPHATLPAGAPGVHFDWMLIVAVAWLVGAVAGVARLAGRYIRLRAGASRASSGWLSAATVAAPDFDLRRVRVHSAGPAVLWALPRSLILLPPDFATRFGDAAARELVLRHELTHVRRGDAGWSLAMEVMSALLWFHPFAWFARPRFRLDQELACDAAALRTQPQHTARYARALLDSVAVAPATALIPWLAEPQLKERLAMLMHMPPGTLRRRAGFAATAALLAGALLVAGGQTPVAAATRGSSAATPPTVDVAYKNSNPPKYPVDALRNGDQGMVILRVHVDADGNVTKVDIDSARTTTSSAELRASAVTAAEGWKFKPGERDGKPVGGWVTIPVNYALAPLDECPAGEAHAAKASFGCAPASSAGAAS